MSVTDEQIKRMAERFLTWKLPDDFNPDAGISFQPVVNAGTQYEHRHQPTGTNLFSYSQAKAMVLHIVQGLSVEKTNDARPRITDERAVFASIEDRVEAKRKTAREKRKFSGFVHKDNPNG